MKKYFYLVLVFLFSSLLYSCNKNLTDDELTELYAKSTTRGNIIDRSGTPMRAGSDEDAKNRQMEDAQNRLRTGGGIFGKKPTNLLELGRKNKEKNVTSIGLPINPYLWRGSLDTISFMPLASANPLAGIIITDWYTDENNINQRCKLNIFILGTEMKAGNLRVNSFCQILSENGSWVDQKVDLNNNIQIENAILNKAKKIKLSQS